LPEALLREIAASAPVLDVRAGEQLGVEGDPADRAFLVVHGRIEISIRIDGAQVPVDTAGPGSLVGEFALLRDDLVRAATITAIKPTRVLELEAGLFAALTERSPELYSCVATAIDEIEIIRFIKRVTAFAELSGHALRELAEHVSVKRFAKGSWIFRQGDVADNCYLVRSGKVEALIGTYRDETEQLATLGEGTMFGEAALLAHQPRNASVRALDDVVLLAIDGPAFIKSVGSDRTVANHIGGLLAMRRRPKLVEGIEGFEHVDRDGNKYTVLKNGAAGTYVRLSEQGLFICTLLDGYHGFRDIALRYLAQYGVLAPEFIMRTIERLSTANFLEEDRAVQAVSRAVQLRRRELFMKVTRSALDWRVYANGVDRWYGPIYRRLLYPLATRPAIALYAVVAVVGTTLFGLEVPRATTLIASAGGLGTFLVALILANIILVILHEGGHLLATYRVGATVSRIGIGWYWFGPIAFVDTSDVWTKSPRARLFVDTAGPAVNVIAAAALAIVAWFTPGAGFVVAWAIALSSYLKFFRNLNPLLELDGYEALADVLDRPSLRRECLGWLAHAVPALFRRPHLPRDHFVEWGYGLCSLAFVVITAVQTAFIYHVTGQRFVARFAPLEVATAVGIALPLVFGFFALTKLIWETQTAKRAM
jgi:CRP-like cAMP-binding protein